MRDYNKYFVKVEEGLFGIFRIKFHFVEISFYLFIIIDILF